jgi:hypothetical protein
MFDPMEAVSLAEALDAIERIGMEIQEANQLSADIDAEFNNLEREYREMIDIQQELVEVTFNHFIKFFA